MKLNGVKRKCGAVPVETEREEQSNHILDETDLWTDRREVIPAATGFGGLDSVKANL